jgi:hypothetical protein
MDAADLLMEDIRARLKEDPTTKARLVNALERVSLNGEGYVSMTDSISLRNFLCEVYELPVMTFDNVHISQLRGLGEEMLAENRRSEQ